MNTTLAMNNEIQGLGLGCKLTEMLKAFRYDNIISRISEMFENISDSNVLDYVGEFNKNDIMP